MDGQKYPLPKQKVGETPLDSESKAGRAKLTRPTFLQKFNYDETVVEIKRGRKKHLAEAAKQKT